MASIASWIYDKPLRGHYTFTHDEVAQAFPDMNWYAWKSVLSCTRAKMESMSRLGKDDVLLL